MVADASPNTYEQKLTYIYETSSSSSNHLTQYSFMIYINTHKCFQMSSSSDVSDSDSSERVLKEPDPSNVPYYFLKTGKSKSEGVLITHSDSFKFTKNNVNRNGTLHYYACSMKLTHKCPARAILRRTVELDENGEEVVLNELLEIATPEVSWILYIRMDCH